MRMDDAPARFCLDCRTLLGRDAACDGGRFHRVVSLGTEGGAERVRAQVWGPPDLRKRAADSAKAGTLGAFAQGAVDGCSGCTAGVGTSLEGLALLLLGMLVAFVVVGLVLWVAETLYVAIRRRLTRLRPAGVAGTPPRRRERLRGTIVGGAPISPPVGEGAGVAWGLVARSSDAIGAGDVLLAAGGTDGFSLRLDDGRTLEVPPGRVRVASDGAGWTRVPVPALKDWLAELDGRADSELHPPLPADRGQAAVLATGDRVEVAADLERVAADGGAYRDGAARLRARGVPVLRPLAD
jgi:hypothetical protein